MAVGFILRGSLWVEDGWAGVSHRAMKAQNQAIGNCESFAISAMLRVVIVCLKNVLATR